MVHRPAESQPNASRRDFMKTVGVGAALASTGVVPSVASALEAKQVQPESLVTELFKSLSEAQRTDVCFDWNHKDPRRGLLRTFTANNWHITEPRVASDFYTSQQQEMIREIFKGIIHPDWHARYETQMDDDMGGWGEQSIAIFGSPGDDKYEFVLTGRHMTLRCDGNSADHVAFGGPIFYGHAPEDEETREHDGNVFWDQALAANKVYKMLDGKQRKMAEVARTPREQAVAFRGKSSEITGVPIGEMTADQKELVQKTMQTMVEMFRQSDQDEVAACLKKQGGLDSCFLSFYTDADIGKDKVWDNFRLEGPSFVWHFRGAPHVHVWVNVADDPSVETNS